MTIEKALEKVKERYEKSKGLQWVHDPVVWALYHTLKEADEDEGLDEPLFGLNRDEFNAYTKAMAVGDMEAVRVILQKAEGRKKQDE